LIVMNVVIEEAQAAEHSMLGDLLVRVYASLPGFPTPQEQPEYYATMRDVGALARRPGITLLVARSSMGDVLGGVVYIGDMREYGSGSAAPTIRDAAGFRWLGVDPDRRGLGIGKALAEACIERAKLAGRAQVVIHSTRAMRTAWSMYERLGFRRSPDLDFAQKGLAVYGFRLPLARASAGAVARHA
jgi:GNAT superfamily N-acetyltransferase